VGMYQKSGFGLGANECGVEDVPDVRLGWWVLLNAPRSNQNMSFLRTARIGNTCRNAKKG
jgi:hypothetical protein